MYRYRAYGLRIRSDIPLPELVQADGDGADVTIFVDDAASDVEPVGGQDIVTFSWDEVGVFRVIDGHTVQVEVREGDDEALTRFPIFGPVFGTLLRQRGHIVLHASAVCVDERVVAFIGHKGYGKSTLAASMHARGYPVVADDLLPVQWVNGGAPTTHFGVPQLSLWPESVDALGTDPATLQPLHERVRKKALPVSGARVSRAPLDLAAIYVLGKGEEIAIRALTPREGFVELLRHSYCTNQLDQLDGDAMEGAFRRYAQLARRVPVRRLERYRDLRALPDVARQVEDDLSTMDLPPMDAAGSPPVLDRHL